MKSVARLMMFSVSAGAVVMVPVAGRAARIVTEPFLGVTHYHITDSAPRPLAIHVLEIDLATPGLSFRHSPPDPNPPVRSSVPDETITQKTREYVDEQGAQIGINTSFFRLEHSGESRWTNNVGLATSDGTKYSPWDSAAEFALNITRTNDARIIAAPAGSAGTFNTSPSDLDLYNAVRGSHRIVNAGAITAPARSTNSASIAYLHPRTGVGVNRGRTKLLLFAVDGRQADVSEGMYLDELGQLMLDFGVRNGINLDGGGSTTLAFDYYGDAYSDGGDVAARLVNSPVGRGVPGSERYNGASLAIFAAPNPGFVAPAPDEPPPPPPAGFTIIEDFESNEGRFTGDHTASGTSDGIGASTIVRTTAQRFRGNASQEIDLTYAADTTGNYRLRHLSNGGTPSNDQEPIGRSGHVGYWLKVATPGLSPGDVQASLIVDDGAASERGEFISVIPDGQWHLYEWDLTAAGEWANFNAGDGAITSSSVTIDGLYLNLPRKSDVVVYWDALAWNANGSLAALVPEPASLTLMLTAAFLTSRRRRAPHPRHP